MTMDPTQPVGPVGPVAAVGPREKSGRALNLLLIGAAALAIGGVAFAIGRSTAPAGAFPGVGDIGDGPIVRPGGSFAPGAGGPGGFALNGSLAMDGTVASVDSDTITLTLENGQEVTFAVDGETNYHEATDATAADVAVGDDVSVEVEGGGRSQGGGDTSTTQELTARDVTVSR